MALKTTGLIPRDILAQTFKNPRALLGYEQMQQSVTVEFPTAINTAQDTADGAQVTADDAQFDASSALGIATALQNPSYVVLATSTVLSNEFVLQGGAGVTLPVTPGAVTITVNVVTALGYTPANLAGDTFTGPVKVIGQMGCSTLRIDDTLATTTTASDHSVPVNIGGTTYYIRLSSTP